MYEAYTVYMRILLAEDNQNLGQYVSAMLKENGYAVDWVKDGDAALRYARDPVPDLILLDLLLPKVDGIEVCKTLRSEGVMVPIIMLTALGESEDKVVGLDSGADDYLVKPFDQSELLARMRALLRRPPLTQSEVLEVQDVSLTAATRVALHGADEMQLTVKEYAILEYLMQNAGQVVSRNQILEHCWDLDYNPFSNIVEVYIRQLRTKLHDENEQYIETVRGAGYRFKR
jgi:DNA-binding response OmpR family regulator